MMHHLHKRKRARRETRHGRKGVLADESGQAVVEYILLASVLTVAFAFVTMNLLHEALQGFFDEIAAFVALPVP